MGSWAGRSVSASSSALHSEDELSLSSIRLKWKMIQSLGCNRILGTFRQVDLCTRAGSHMTVGGGQAGSGTEIVQGGLPPLQLVDQV